MPRRPATVEVRGADGRGAVRLHMLGDGLTTAGEPAVADEVPRARPHLVPGATAPWRPALLLP
ncbi:hypothetical protein ACPXCE_28950 [Streptomyces sp. DT24]|uniref:hypothetical protein n=1 Tax=unclassified Streptomyces TaxID=2593676 RepID=UPI0023B92734|nr:hypothetical protein [Streptomyces sp. AM 4-1-1]WEH33059.1 hypothetical protein PZB75_06510 [Streptomyces sp. AM 4-1-1]